LEDTIHEIVGDIWDYLGKAVVCITTNGLVNRKGDTVMGRGCALQAAERFPGLSLHLGKLLAREGNHVHLLEEGLVSFPVEESPWANPDLRLIRRSAEELRAMADRHGWTRVVVPRPGCGGGGLAWSEVRPLLEDILDDRFTIITSDI
jgi:hypothetical protein